MPTYQELNELNRSSDRITEIMEATLYDEGLQDWIIGEIHLVHREGLDEVKVVCKKVDMGGGRFKLVCKRPEDW